MTVDRNALEIRLLLDLLAYELHRLGTAPGGPIRIFVGTPDLSDDLADRLWPDLVVADEGPSRVDVHLLDLEEVGVPDGFEADHVAIVFRNRTSHKSLLKGGWRGLGFASLERRLRRTHRVFAARGVMGPSVLTRLLIAEAASRNARFGRGFLLRDRALLSPSETGVARFLCPYGIVVASRRT